MSDITWGLWELLLKGVWITVQLTVYSAALAAVVAFGIGLARTHPRGSCGSCPGPTSRSSAEPPR